MKLEILTTSWTPLPSDARINIIIFDLFVLLPFPTLELPHSLSSAWHPNCILKLPSPPQWMLSYAFINTPIPLEHFDSTINSGPSHSLLQILNIYVWFYMSGFNQYLSYKLDFNIPWERNIAMLLYILSGASSKWQLKKYAQSKLFECTKFWINSTGKICWKHRCWSRWEAVRHSPDCGLYFSLFCGTLTFLYCVVPHTMPAYRGVQLLVCEEIQLIMGVLFSAYHLNL